MSQAALRLGVNIDHVATLRNARGGAVPDPRARGACWRSRRARRHNRASARGSAPYPRRGHGAAARSEISKPLNFEMAATDEMVGDRTCHAAACVLSRAGKAQRAHDGRRPRSRERRMTAEADHRGTRSCRRESSLFIEPAIDALEAAARSALPWSSCIRGPGVTRANMARPNAQNRSSHVCA